MRNRNIDADQLEPPGALILLVVIDGFSVLQDLGYGRDERDEAYKVLSEFCNISDFEEGIELCLLWKTASALDRQHCSNRQWEIVYKISPWMLLRSRVVGLDIVLCCMWEVGNIHPLLYLSSHYLKTESSERSETVRTMYSGVKIDSSKNWLLARGKKKLDSMALSWETHSHVPTCMVLTDPRSVRLREPSRKHDESSLAFRCIFLY